MKCVYSRTIKAFINCNASAHILIPDFSLPWWAYHHWPICHDQFCRFNVPGGHCKSPPLWVEPNTVRQALSLIVVVVTFFRSAMKWRKCQLSPASFKFFPIACFFGDPEEDLGLFYRALQCRTHYVFLAREEFHYWALSKEADNFHFGE